MFFLVGPNSIAKRSQVLKGREVSANVGMPQNVVNIGEDYLRSFTAVIFKPLLNNRHKTCPEKGEVVFRGGVVHMTPAHHRLDDVLEKLGKCPIQAIL